MTGTELATRTTATKAAADISPPPIFTPWMMRIEEHPRWEMLAQLRMTLRAGVMLKHLRVRDLLSLREGQVFESRSSATEDVPIEVGQRQLGWGEFEVIQQRMALRLTRLG